VTLAMASVLLLGLRATNLTISAISSIVVAVQMIVSHCKKLKYRKKIVLVTNGLGAIDNDELDQIAGKIKQENIDLVIL
jgi:ATP-dependent DNA helicase 2 subunit 2